MRGCNSEDLLRDETRCPCDHLGTVTILTVQLNKLLLELYPRLPHEQDEVTGEKFASFPQFLQSIATGWTDLQPDRQVNTLLFWIKTNQMLQGVPGVPPDHGARAALAAVLHAV